MKTGLKIVLAAVGALLYQSASAAYTRAYSVPVEINAIYSNEHGSPYVTFKTSVNSACASGGTGLYLYDITASQPSWDLRKNKMASLLGAKFAGKRVRFDYFFDPGLSPGWEACFIQGLEIVD